MAYKLLPGIRQDHRGRDYQLAVYPSGKLIQVPYTRDGAEQARMIPIVNSPIKPRAMLTLKGYDMTRRRMQVHFRIKGEQEIRTLQDQNDIAQAFVDQHRAVRDAEGTLQRESHWDWFFQQHVDLKEGA